MIDSTFQMNNTIHDILGKYRCGNYQSIVWEWITNYFTVNNADYIGESMLFTIVQNQVTKSIIEINAKLPSLQKIIELTSSNKSLWKIIPQISFIIFLKCFQLFTKIGVTISLYKYVSFTLRTE